MDACPQVAYLAEKVPAPVRTRREDIDLCPLSQQKSAKQKQVSSHTSKGEFTTTDRNRARRLFDVESAGGGLRI